MGVVKIVVSIDPRTLSFRLEVSIDKEGFLLVMMSVSQLISLDKGLPIERSSSLPRILDFLVSIDNTVFFLVVLLTATALTDGDNSVTLK